MVYIDIISTFGGIVHTLYHVRLQNATKKMQKESEILVLGT